MHRLVVIANPVASQFTGGSHRDVMAVLSKSHDVEALWPSSAADAVSSARDAVSRGADVVVAMGGDGMVHHVAQAVVHTEAALGIIPVGTTNVVARILSIPSRPTKAAKLIAAFRATTPVGVATMTLNRGVSESEHHAIFACGFGLDAEVVIEADRDPYGKYRFGSLHYARSALGVGIKEFPKRAPHLEVSSGSQRARASTVLLQFRDTYTYFGKIPIRFTDDLPRPMTALILETLKRRRIPRIAVNALTKRDLGAVPGIQMWREINLLRLEADPPVAVQADGESLGMVNAASVRWSPDSLRVVRNPNM